ncbi:MAG: PQQ-binding-like beta-propeller repeat protein [candidate division WOR-3 bacterium]|nr:MAG: PQQ-binding-like beta-propeller repeat protein [candidate division WOR-3 bacterium]
MKNAVLVVALASAATLSAHPWTCFHGDPQHSGLSMHSVGESLSVAWTYPAGGDISGSAVVNDAGQVLFGARDVKLYCIRGSGTEAWVADLDSLGTSIYFTAPALDDEGNVYVTTNRKLVKVDSTGTVVWRYPDHNALSISHSPVIGDDGKIYFACYSDSLYALTQDGRLEWASDLGLDVNSAPAVGLDGNIYVATTRGSGGWRLWAFAPNGDIAWTFPLAGEADFASPAVGPDSTVYVGADRYLYAVSAGGRLKWRDSLPASIRSCPAIADDSTLYVSAGSYVYNVSADSGTRWRKYLGGSNYSSPAIDANGIVYVGSALGYFYVLASDSTVLWSRTMPDNVWSSPAIGADGRVFFGCMDGTFHAFQGPGVGVRAGSPLRQPGLATGPNPTTGLVHLGLSGRTAERVFVYNSLGAAVDFGRSGNAVDLAGLPSGVYLLELVTSAGTSRARIVLH